MNRCSFEAVNLDAFSYYRQLGKLVDFCSVHYGESIDLERAAQICGFERTYFSTFFHEKVGVCFICWLGLVRVNNAKDLIHTKNYSITRIGEECGFGSLSNFQRVFKRATGMTPMDYKKSSRPS